MKKNVRVIGLEGSKIVQTKSVIEGYKLENNELFSNNGFVGQIKDGDVFVDDPQDLINQNNEDRKKVLRQLIADMKLLDLNCKTEQDELAELLEL